MYFAYFLCKKKLLLSKIINLKKMNCINKLIVITMLFSLFSCSEDKKTEKEDFVFQTEQFDDVKILRYQVPNFENLTIKQKEFIYYLYEAKRYII